MMLLLLLVILFCDLILIPCFSHYFFVVTALPLLLAIIVFGAMAFDRHWLLYPSFNHLDWAYFIAIVSLVLCIAASMILLSETREARRRRKKMHNLVYNIQSRS